MRLAAMESLTRSTKYFEVLHYELFILLRELWWKGNLDESSQLIFRKEASSEQIGQFRPISLLNVDGKIYMGILPKRTVDFLQNNGYIGASVQKAGISGIPGCIEHVPTIWEAIQEAKTSKTI